jgi:hypothetical protein
MDLNVNLFKGNKIGYLVRVRGNILGKKAPIGLVSYRVTTALHEY